MNVTSGIVKKQVQSGRRGYAKQHDRLACRCNRSTEQLPADRTQLEVAHFPSPRSSAACSIGSPTCAWRFSKAASADALAHENARSPHPRRIAGDDFSERLFPQARPGQKEPSAYFDQIYVVHCRATTSP